MDDDDNVEVLVTPAKTLPRQAEEDVKREPPPRKKARVMAVIDLDAQHDNDREFKELGVVVRHLHQRC